MSLSMKPAYANLRSNSTGKIGTPKTAQPVLSRYLRNSTGSCHDRCKHGNHALQETKTSNSSSQRGHKVRISIFKRLYDRKFVVPAASDVSPTNVRSPDKYLYIVPSNGAKKVVGPIEQKGDSSPWLPSCPAKKKVRCSKKETCSKVKLVPSPMVERSRRRAEKRAQCNPSAITPDSSLKPRETELTYINPRNGDDDHVGKYEEKRHLQFKRGKVVDPRGECSIMWRLKFRKSRVIDDIQSVAEIGRRRSYKRVEGSATPKKSKSESIVLRHCESEKVEKDQSLLNNVIEQTASKLVESRKSKVKALVGAFESVISLQHPKTRVVVKACC